MINRYSTSIDIQPEKHRSILKRKNTHLKRYVFFYPYQKNLKSIIMSDIECSEVTKDNCRIFYTMVSFDVNDFNLNA